MTFATLRSRQRGMGIIELMVALLIGLIMAVALAWFYLGSRTLSRTSEDVSRLQESGRNALELIGMSIRQAGYRNYNSQQATAQALAGTHPGSVPDTITVSFEGQEGSGELDCTGNLVSDKATVQAAFTVDRTTNPPGLNCNGVRVVDNIEDMQISYGIDADRDGQIESYKALPASPLEFSQVSAVRIALLVRGPSTMAAANKAQTLIFNGNTVAYTDGYLRQVYNGTFTVRAQAY